MLSKIYSHLWFERKSGSARPLRGMNLGTLHRIALVSVRLFCKNLGNLQEFFGQMVYRLPSWQKIARTPMDGHDMYTYVQLFR